MKRKAKANCATSLEKKRRQSRPSGRKITTEAVMQVCIYILLVLTLSDLGSLDSRHLLSPALGRLRLLDSAEVIGREARDTHVVVALEDELNIAQLEGRGRAQLCETTGLGDDFVDEVVCHLEDELEGNINMLDLIFISLSL